MIPIKKLIGYRGWKVWMSYDMHITLLALFYILIADNLFRPLDSLVLITSIGFYFMYGFLINDYFDMEYDIAVGKKRRIQEISKKSFIGIILVVVFISALHLLYLKEVGYIVTYIGSYILATLYSAPPVRFKSQGFSGIVVCALIEKMLPVLAIFTFFNHFGLDTLIFLAASFFIHISEIVMHQILDYENDLRIKTRTFVVDIGLDKALKIFKNFIAPFSGTLIIILSVFISIKVPYASFLVIVVLLIYAIISILISKGNLSKEEKIFPLYLSSLFLVIHNVLPPFLGFILSLNSSLNAILLLIAICSQYYVVKYRFKAIKEKAISHIEIFVDT